MRVKSQDLDHCHLRVWPQLAKTLFVVVSLTIDTGKITRPTNTIKIDMVYYEVWIED